MFIFMLTVLPIKKVKKNLIENGFYTKKKILVIIPNWIKIYISSINEFPEILKRSFKYKYFI